MGADVHNTGAEDTTADGEPTGVDHVFLALERELAVFLRRARASSGELAREVHPDLEPAAYGLLVRLADAGAQRATDLAGYFGVGKATMSRQLHALEKLGLVAREPDPADGRAVWCASPRRAANASPASAPAAAPGTPAAWPPGTAARSPNSPVCCTG